MVPRHLISGIQSVTAGGKSDHCAFAMLVFSALLECFSIRYEIQFQLLVDYSLVSRELAQAIVILTEHWRSSVELLESVQNGQNLVSMYTGLYYTSYYLVLHIEY